MHKRRTLIRLWVVVALPLLACTAATSILFPPSTPTNDHSSAILTILSAERTPSVTATASPQPASHTPTYAATQIPNAELGVELSDRKIEASNPEEFVRGLGKPQVVELFAFW